MDSRRHQPYRQCIGCRKVRPKEDLLRFVQDPSDGVVFDGMSRLDGRGFYLCPDARCFADAYKNRRKRITYFRRYESINELIQEVRKALLSMIENDLVRCEKMGCLSYGGGDEEHGRGGLSDPCAEASLHVEASERAGTVSARRIHLPPTGGLGGRYAAVRSECPAVSRLAVNLKKYEVLSSKGLAL